MNDLETMRHRLDVLLRAELQRGPISFQGLMTDADIREQVRMIRALTSRCPDRILSGRLNAMIVSGVVRREMKQFVWNQK